MERGEGKGAGQARFPDLDTPDVTNEARKCRDRVDNEHRQACGMSEGRCPENRWMFLPSAQEGTLG